jgi:hypothetical protein
LIIKQIFNLSWRDLEYNLKSILNDQEIPDFTTLFYRANKIDQEFLKKCINLLSAQIIAEIGDIDSLIVDGTGFGYNEMYKQTWERGKRLKEVKSHIKTEVLIAVKGNLTFPIGVAVGLPYSDERKLLREILDKVKIAEGSLILGDKIYGMDNKLAKKLIDELKVKPIIPVEDSIRYKVRDPYRKKLKEIYEENKELYKGRYRIEQLFGKIKNAYGDRDNTRIYKLASVFVLMRFLIYNIAVLLAILFYLPRFFKHIKKSKKNLTNRAKQNR